MNSYDALLRYQRYTLGWHDHDWRSCWPYGKEKLSDEEKSLILNIETKSYEEHADWIDKAVRMGNLGDIREDRKDECERLFWDN